MEKQKQTHEPTDSTLEIVDKDFAVQANQIRTRETVFRAIGGTVDLGLDVGEFALKQGLNIAEFGLTATGYTIGKLARITRGTAGAVMSGLGRGAKRYFEKRMAA